MNISFSKENKSKLNELSNVNAQIGQLYRIEYFDNVEANLNFLSTKSKELNQVLNDLCDGNKICADFEWKPDVKDEELHPISVFQFSTSKGIVVVLNDSIPNFYNSKNDNNSDNNNDNINLDINKLYGKDNENDSNNSFACLLDFLSRNNFFGKGMKTDLIKLKNMFNKDFSENFEDVELSFLKTRNLPLSFNSLVKKVLGKPSASFKDINISKSDWSKRPLSLKQLLYAGFDVYAIHRIYQFLTNNPNFIGNGDLANGNMNNNVDKRCPKSKSKEIKITNKKALKIRNKFTIVFDKYPNYLESLKLEPIQFIEHNRYEAKWTLYYYYLTISKITPSSINLNSKIETNHCRICNVSFLSVDEIVEHLWLNHFEDVPSLYFLLQSPAYLNCMLQQILITQQNMEFFAKDNHVECKTCKHSFRIFRGLYTHCRKIHKPDATKIIPIDIKNLLFEHLQSLHLIMFKPKKDDTTKYSCSKIKNQTENEPNKKDDEDTNAKALNDIETNGIFDCVICNLEFGDKLSTVEHCWSKHYDVFVGLWKHRPAPYPDEIFDECEKLGIICLTKYLAATIHNGVYSCCLCVVGFDSPGEVFIHLFHRHTIVKTVNAAHIDEWPIKISDLPESLIAVMNKLCFVSAEESLEKEGVFDRFGEVVRCNECCIVFDSSDEMWDHMIHKHMILDFDIGQNALHNEGILD